MRPEVNEAYCIYEEETSTWHAVLGNHYPNFPGDLPQMSDSEEVALELTQNPEERAAQRLCDQQLVLYKYVSIRNMTGADPVKVCPRCIRITDLMEEFATKYPEEAEDGIDGSNGIEQPGTA